jgi:hypothetical protein
MRATLPSLTGISVLEHKPIFNSESMGKMEKIYLYAFRKAVLFHEVNIA